VLSALAFFLQFLATAPVHAGFPVQHTPLRRWIKLAAIAYQPATAMPDRKIEWAATHFDLLIGTDPKLMSAFKARTDAPILEYDNYYCLYVGDDKYRALMNYAAARHLDAESMFLHFAEPTTLAFGDGTRTVPAGSRVPSYGWYGSDGDLKRDRARVVMNPRNAGYRAFNSYYQEQRMNEKYGNASYDGLFVDNSTGGGISVATGKVVSGGAVVEYPGSKAERDLAYDSDMIKTFQEVRSVLAKEANGKKLQVANIANEAKVWEALFPNVEGVFREYLIQPARQTAEALDREIHQIQKASDTGVFNIISETVMGKTSTDMPREKITGLAAYYLMSTPNTYLNRQDSNSGDLQSYEWFPAVEYDIGLPKGAAGVLSVGIDPSSPLKDEGVGTVACSRQVCTVTDSSKNWAVNQWQRWNLIDSADQVFGNLRGSEANAIQINLKGPPYPVSGKYRVGSYAYTIFAREFEKALVVDKPMATWQVKESGTASATMSPLPATADNPTGVYYQLNVDGTVGRTPLKQVSLRNAEGMILIKASAIVH
jgi:hypothetical protein